MIKRLPPETLKYLLDMYNKILVKGEITRTWKQATITHLLKEGKDQKYIRSYIPVALIKHTLQNIQKDDKQETGLVPGKGEENK